MNVVLVRRFVARGMLLFAALCAQSGPVGADAPNPGMSEQPRLVVLGDSISAGYGIAVASGWVALLDERLRRTGYGYRVVNASVSGETTAGALARLAHVLEVHSPAIVVIELGGNDGLRGLPIAQTHDHLAAIVKMVQDSGAVAIVVGMRMPSNYGPTYTQRFAELYAEVASDRHAPLVPFLLAAIADDEANFQADRIHPTATAQPKLLDTLWPVLEPVLKARQKPAHRP